MISELSRLLDEGVVFSQVGLLVHVSLPRDDDLASESPLMPLARLVAAQVRLPREAKALPK